MSLNPEDNEIQINLTEEQLRKLPHLKVKAMMDRLKGIKLSLAVIKLYKGANKNWEFVSEGCLFLVEDGKVLSFHLMNIETAETIWHHELYENIVIHLLQEYFAAFEGTIGNKGKTTLWGISFAHVYDGKEFCRRVMTAVKKKHPKKKKTTLFSGIKNFFKKEKKQQRKRAMISGPTNFKNVGHIGSLGDIPPDWMDFLKKDVGADLKSEETLDRIFRVLKMFEEKKKEQSADEEGRLRKEIDVIKEIEDIDQKIRDLENRKQILNQKLKKMREEKSGLKDSDLGRDEFAEFLDAEEEDWIDAGKDQPGTPLPPGSPPAGNVPPPFPPPDISNLMLSEERIKKQGPKKPKQNFPKLTEKVKDSFMDLMRRDIERRRELMNMEHEEKEEMKKGDGGDDWSDEESDERKKSESNDDWSDED